MIYWHWGNLSASTAQMECKYRITPLHNLFDDTV